MMLSPETIDELREVRAEGDERDRAMAGALLAAAGEDVDGEGGGA